MNENAIVVINETVGSVTRPALVIVAMSGARHDHLREFSARAKDFHDDHPGTPPLLFLGSQHGGWTVLQTDDPAARALAAELGDVLGMTESELVAP